MTLADALAIGLDHRTTKIGDTKIMSDLGRG
jgi:hypothetical protein